MDTFSNNFSNLLATKGWLILTTTVSKAFNFISCRSLHVLNYKKLIK